MTFCLSEASNGAYYDSWSASFKLDDRRKPVSALLGVRQSVRDEQQMASRRGKGYIEESSRFEEELGIEIDIS